MKNKFLFFILSVFLLMGGKQVSAQFPANCGLTTAQADSFRLAAQAMMHYKFATKDDKYTKCYYEGGCTFPFNSTPEYYTDLFYFESFVDTLSPMLYKLYQLAQTDPALDLMLDATIKSMIEPNNYFYHKFDILRFANADPVKEANLYQGIWPSGYSLLDSLHDFFGLTYDPTDPYGTSFNVANLPNFEALDSLCKTHGWYFMPPPVIVPFSHWDGEELIRFYPEADSIRFSLNTYTYLNNGGYANYMITSVGYDCQAAVIDDYSLGIDDVQLIANSYQNTINLKWTQAVSRSIAIDRLSLDRGDVQRIYESTNALSGTYTDRDVQAGRYVYTLFDTRPGQEKVLARTEVGVSPITEIFYEQRADQLYIDFGTEGQHTVSIYDIQGRALRSSELQNRENTIDVSGLSTGLYILQLDQQSIKWIKK